jgi:hypothetical protein
MTSGETKLYIIPAVERVRQIGEQLRRHKKRSREGESGKIGAMSQPSICDHMMRQLIKEKAYCEQLPPMWLVSSDQPQSQTSIDVIAHTYDRELFEPH